MKQQNGSSVNTTLTQHFETDSYPICFIFIWSKFNWMDNKNIKDLRFTMTSLVPLSEDEIK